MSKKLHVALSPITNTIYCGSVSKDGRSWLSNRTEVTGEACAAVAMHVLQHGDPVVVNENGTPRFRITVEDLAAQREGE